MDQKRLRIGVKFIVNRTYPLIRMILVLFIFLISACFPPTPEVTPTAIIPTLEPTATAIPTLPAPTPVAEPPIYLAIIWHQHQPVYFKDPETGIYSKPWVRVHATKDYVDMAAILEDYPDIRATFNITPSLIRQIRDLEAGAKDLYWILAEVPAEQLSAEQEQFILERFFDTNRRVIARFPRYQELLVKRDGGQAYTTQDFLDLQILFNLAWVDPDWLEEEPLSSLVTKGSNFVEADKQILFEEHERLIAEVIPVHKRLLEAGQIEITMTPFAHPILPLLVSTDLARVAMPDVEMPSVRFQYGADAVEQVRLGVELYEETWGIPPKGMWPAEGAVAQEIVTMVASHGIQWMASDEGVLANSLGFTSFTRDAGDVVTEPDLIYRPYYVQGVRGDPVAMVFRDVLISDRVGFIYSGMPGQQAARDFVNRIRAIRDKLLESGAEGPHLVSVILDGENAWEYYENDGKEFLHAMYRLLSEDPLIKTVTPSEFLEIAPDQPMIEQLWAGSWINHDFSTWIGEEEENVAWEYLAETRDFLQRYIGGQRQAPSPEALEEAKILMYIAEGSDWFWWYGDDQDSGDDESFDRQFRDTLKQVYLTLGVEPPLYLDVPIIPQRPQVADQPSVDLFTPTVDGNLEPDEWEAAGYYLAGDRVIGDAQPFFERLAYGFDSRNLYLLITSQPDLPVVSGVSNLEVYLRVPGGGAVNSFSRGGSLLGFASNRVMVLTFQDGVLETTELYEAAGKEDWDTSPTSIESVAAGEGVIEVALPLAQLNNLDSGDRLTMKAFYNQEMEIEGVTELVDMDQVPGLGPALVAVPDLGTTVVILDVEDPTNDDHGPGTYTYPRDAVFTSGNFDILNFQVGFDEDNIVFRFSLRGPVDNPWGSPNGLSVQTFDIYIDQSGDGSGGDNLLPGRNLALQAGYSWDYAITVEGWDYGIYVPGEEGPTRIAPGSQFSVLTDPGQRRVTIRVPKSILGDNPQDWRYAAMVLGQEGFPAGGVMRVRDVNPVAEQWRFGGAPPGSSNHTRVIDFVWPVEGDQEAWLSDFTAKEAMQSELTAEDFARVPMLEVPGEG
jgi:alpha-amylase/alpha-mannosidase (GH57 family)